MTTPAPEAHTTWQDEIAAGTLTREQMHEEISDGTRCYDCGEKFTLTEAQTDGMTDTEWRVAEPKHARCFL